MIFPKNSADWAAWIQAIGSVVAILVAIWIAGRQHRETERREARHRVQRRERSLGLVRYLIRETVQALETPRTVAEVLYGPERPVPVYAGNVEGHVRRLGAALDQVEAGEFEPREVVVLMAAREEIRSFLEAVAGMSSGKDDIALTARRTAKAIREAAADTGWL